MPLFDLTWPFGAATPVYPGDPAVAVRLDSDVARGDPYTARSLTLGAHAGTHVDAPAHLLPSGARLDQLPLELWVGPARLIDRGELENTDLAGVRRLLIAGCPHGLAPAAARRLVAAGVALVGVEGPSVDPIGSEELPVHRILLGAGLALIEHLRLEGAPRGEGMLYCLPLAIEDGDGAPARVLWEPRGGRGVRS